MPTVSWKNYRLLGWVITLDILETWVIFLTVLLLLLSQGFYSTCKVIQNQTWLALSDTKVHMSHESPGMKRAAGSGLASVTPLDNEESWAGLAQRPAVCGLQKHVAMAFLNLEARHGLLCSCVCFLLRTGATTVAVCNPWTRGEWMTLFHAPPGLVAVVDWSQGPTWLGVTPLSTSVQPTAAKTDPSLALWPFYWGI